jgi:hypothetical protein
MERETPVPHPVRGAALALVGAALAVAILFVGGVFDVAVSALERAADDSCVTVDDAVGGSVIRCTHVDEPPPGVRARDRSAKQLIAEAGGAGVVARFASAQPGATIDVDRTGLGGTAGPVTAGFVGDVDGPLAVASTVPTTGTPGIPCWGNGSSGNRVQAVYAYTGTDRSSTYIPLIRKWAAEADVTVRVSAQQSGGRRHVNWVHTSSCVLSVMKVKLSSSAATSFSRTISEMAAKGLKRTDRRYLVWFDANRYCGIGTLYADDRSTKANRNNGSPYGPTGYSRIDRQCWGLFTKAWHSTEAHELMHNLGAVQNSAPHSTKAGHCFDEYDVMCYDDGGSRSTMKKVCTVASYESWLDCRKDDYFNVKPKSGTYLYSHWNVARSSFLNAYTTSDPILTAFSAAALPGALSDPTGDVKLSWSVVADAAIAQTVLERSVDGGSYAPLATVTGTALTTTQSVDRGHEYAFRITVYDSVGRRSLTRVSESVDMPRDFPPTVSVPAATISYNADSISTVLVTWSASDEEGYVVLAELERSTDGVAWVPAWSGAEEAAEVTVPSGATYTFRVRAKDSAGQWSAWSASAPLVVPVGPVDAPPAVTSTPVAEAWYATGTTTHVWITWDASDDRGVVRSRVEVARDGGPYAVSTTVGDPTSAEVSVAQGHSYTFRVTVYDQIDQASAPATTAPLVVPIDVPPVITSGPTATIASSTWNAQNPPTIEVAFAATDETAVEHVELWRGPSATGPWTVVTDWWSPDWSPLSGQVPPGATYWFKLVAVDTGGHSAAKVTPSGLAIAAQLLPAVTSTPTAAISQDWAWASGDYVEVTVSYATLRTAYTEVSVSGDGGATWEFVAGGDGSSAVAYVPAGGSYRFRVVAFSAEGLTAGPAATAGALVVPDTGP